ncbi:MAG: hypothetical protein RLZZ371_2474 [Pseudomonadota bacterium]|jgi:hypothetical protein
MNSLLITRYVRLALVVAGLAMSALGVMANNLGENSGWQFGTTQDKVNRSVTLDQIEKKKAGYYDAIRPVYNYTTYIERQYNCSLTSSTLGNSGTNSTTATNSSPTVSNTGATTSSALANSASNSFPGSGSTNTSNATGATSASAAYSLPSSLANSQTNGGSLNSGVTGSNTNATTGSVTAGSGASDQVLNSQQSNAGNLTASVVGSTACSGPFN